MRVRLQSGQTARNGSGHTSRLNAQRTFVLQALDVMSKIAKSEAPLYFTDPMVGKAKFTEVAAVAQQGYQDLEARRQCPEPQRWDGR